MGLTFPRCKCENNSAMYRQTPHAQSGRDPLFGLGLFLQLGLNCAYRCDGDHTRKPQFEDTNKVIMDRVVDC